MTRITRTLARLTSLATLLTACAVAHAADGLIAVKSPHSAKETMNRFEAQMQQRGMKTFARVDHAAGAATVNKTLRATEVLIFGGPQGGTPLMECAQSMGIDLPLKALVWEDAQGQVWLGVNDVAWLAARHKASSPCPAVEGVGKVLGALSAAAVAP
jgi:uncharacterized protein (DUF302 family)